jgi:hypothetical protein
LQPEFADKQRSDARPSSAPSAIASSRRSERRTGELLKELSRADTSKGGDLKSPPKRAEPIPTSPYAKALADTGISTV